MTVYTVEKCYAYEGCEVVGVLPTLEAAEAAVEVLKKKDRFADKWEIKKWTVGEYET